jgi:hypothetical protein
LLLAGNPVATAVHLHSGAIGEGELTAGDFSALIFLRLGRYINVLDRSQERDVMPKYLFEVDYSAEGTRGLIKDDRTKRRAVRRGRHDLFGSH